MGIISFNFHIQFAIKSRPRLLSSTSYDNFQLNLANYS